MISYWVKRMWFPTPSHSMLWDHPREVSYEAWPTGKWFIKNVDEECILYLEMRYKETVEKRIKRKFWFDKIEIEQRNFLQFFPESKIEYEIRYPIEECSNDYSRKT